MFYRLLHESFQHQQYSYILQHVQGKFNVEDKTGTYAHIVGGGTSDTDRKNIHTIDWSGNAEFAGGVTATSVILASSTPGSTKKFRLTVSDSGELTINQI